MRKLPDKGLLLEANRDYIIAEYTATDGPQRTKKSLAKEFDVNRKTIAAYLNEWCQAGLMEDRSKTPIDADKGTILELWYGGMSIREIAKKWAVGQWKIQNALSRWIGYEPEDICGQSAMQKIPISEIENRWSELTNRAVGTVDGIPRLYLTPIAAGDE